MKDEQTRTTHEAFSFPGHLPYTLHGKGRQSNKEGNSILHVLGEKPHDK